MQVLPFAAVIVEDYTSISRGEYVAVVAAPYVIKIVADSYNSCSDRLPVAAVVVKYELCVAYCEDVVGRKAVYAAEVDCGVALHGGPDAAVVVEYGAVAAGDEGIVSRSAPYGVKIFGSAAVHGAPRFGWSRRGGGCWCGSAAVATAAACYCSGQQNAC